MRKLSILLILIFLSLETFSQDPLKYNLSVLRSHDLSDSYGGGQMLSSEFKLSKSWFGGSIGFGFYQAVSYMKISIIVEEINETIEIKSPEFSNLKFCNLSLHAIPIDKKWFTTELFFGLAFLNAKSLNVKDLDFSYNHTTKEFDYLKRNYEINEKKLYGYNAGIGCRFKIYKPLGLRIYFGLQDMKTATFAFVGYGLDFSF